MKQGKETITGRNTLRMRRNGIIAREEEEASLPWERWPWRARKGSGPARLPPGPPRQVRDAGVPSLCAKGDVVKEMHGSKD